MRANAKDIARFKRMLVRSGDCMLFPNGDSIYGQFSFFDEDSRKRMRIGSHRFAYMVAFGYIPDGMCVMHQCDTPRCCNPTHLSLGTQKDNIRDMMKKDRHPIIKIKKSKPNKPKQKAIRISFAELKKL